MVNHLDSLLFASAPIAFCGHVDKRNAIKWKEAVKN